MNIKKAAMKIVGLITNTFANDTSCGSGRSIDDELPEPDTQTHEALALLLIPEPQPLSAYEARRTEIEESGDPIEGIFYLYDSQIVPDYYSECLFSDKHNFRRKAMHHSDFHPNYMLKKFEGLPYGEKSLPRGRIVATGTLTIIHIDKCYFKDADTIRRLIELYHLSGRINI